MKKHRIRMDNGWLTVDTGSPLDQAHSAGVLHGLRLALRYCKELNTPELIRAAIKRRQK